MSYERAENKEKARNFLTFSESGAVNTTLLPNIQISRLSLASRAMYKRAAHGLEGLLSSSSNVLYF